MGILEVDGTTGSRGFWTNITDFVIYGIHQKAADFRLLRMEANTPKTSVCK